MSKKNQQPETFSIIGNLGRDPKEHSFPAKSGTRPVYDHITDEVIEKEYAYPEKNFLTFSLCSGGFGDLPERWFQCVDEEGICFRLRKGDRVRLTGYFKYRNRVDKNNELERVRDFMVVDFQVLKWKIRAEAA